MSKNDAQMSGFAEVEKVSSHLKLLKTRKRSSLFVRIRSWKQSIETFLKINGSRDI